MEWIKKLIPSLGLLIGIIFVAIGATMLISSSFKLIFDVSEVYEDRYLCEYRWDRELEQDIKQSSEQIEACLEKNREAEEARFVARKTDDIIDGVAFLVVGIFFWVFFWKRQT
jgi:predicted GTPase